MTDKCERLDNLPLYCSGVLEFRAKKSDFEAKKRELEATKAAEKLVTKSPLNFTLKSIQFSRNDASIKTIFSVINPNIIVINLLSISYDITMHGEKIASGGVGDVKSTVMDCPAYCFDIKSLSSRDFAIPLGVSSSILTQGSFPYIVNGTYRYENSSSDIVSKQFNFTSQL